VRWTRAVLVRPVSFGIAVNLKSVRFNQIGASIPRDFPPAKMHPASPHQHRARLNVGSPGSGGIQASSSTETFPLTPQHAVHIPPPTSLPYQGLKTCKTSNPKRGSKIIPYLLTGFFIYLQSVLFELINLLLFNYHFSITSYAIYCDTKLFFSKYEIWYVCRQRLSRYIPYALIILLF